MGIARVIVAFAIAALVGACDSPRTPLAGRDLKVAAQQLQSIAAEADWLAQQLQGGVVTRNMAWVHQQALGDDAAKALRELAKPVPQALREEHGQVLAIAAQLQAQLGRIATVAKQPAELQAVREELEAVGRAVKPLAAPS
jgi:hypothetical protein